MNQVDALDEQILAALQAQGRLTMKALAEQVGLSSPAMIERVRRLEERGVIAGYRAVIKPEALGRPITAVITATVERGRYDSFLARVQEESAIAECHRITGDATYLLKAHLPTMAALESLVDELTIAGSHCNTDIVLSSPVAYRPITPPEGTTMPRTRLTRRRRRAVAATEGGAAAAPAETSEARRPGRPRGRRRDEETDGE
ncbi:MAG: Lrp/AsnC family transcriptional regulator [Thermomicrobiales bacterium]|nr:Lrp/AsnC family transcriptional regulator [Thermomicrobiales bacterium]